MRPDMHEVVIERPRYGSSRKRKKDRWSWLTDEDGERSPRRASTSRHRGGTRELNDLLGPLRRFLDSSVGRPWDAVYSELRAQISPKSQIHRHILQHVDHMVDRHGAGRARYYLDPKTGLLRRNPTWHGHLRDAERGDHVSLRRWLQRRAGRPWAEVQRQLEAVGRAHGRRVTEEVRHEQGRVLPVVPASPWHPSYIGPPLVRGQLYVEAGYLRMVP